MDRLENGSSLIKLVIVIVSQQGVVVVRVGDDVVLRVWDNDSWSKNKFDWVIDILSVPDLWAGL